MSSSSPARLEDGGKLKAMDIEQSSPRSWECSRQLCVRILLHVFGLILLSGLVFLIVFFWGSLRDAFSSVLAFLSDQASDYPVTAALILTAANIVAALLFLPCIPFTLSAGILFGVWKGVAIISVASIISAILAFLTGRYLARSVVEKNLGGSGSKWRIIDNAINSDGLKFVFLLRLSPLAPFSPMNYLFGLSSVTMWDYVIASFFGMMPTTIMEVYSGAQLNNIEEVIKGEASDATTSIFWVGLAVTIVVTTVITVWVRRKLKHELERYEDRSLVVSANEGDGIEELELAHIDTGSGDGENDEEIVVIDELSDSDDEGSGRGQLHLHSHPVSKPISRASSPILSLPPRRSQSNTINDKSSITEEQKQPHADSESDSAPTMADLETSDDYSYSRRYSHNNHTVIEINPKSGVKSRLTSRSASRQASPQTSPANDNQLQLSPPPQRSPSIASSRTLLLNDVTLDSEYDSNDPKHR